jgi:hypothetical protein
LDEDLCTFSVRLGHPRSGTSSMASLVSLGAGKKGHQYKKGETTMSKIVRFEFLGKRWLFWLLFVTGIGIPYALLYLLEGTVRVDEKMENPSEFLEAFRTGKLRGKG